MELCPMCQKRMKKEAAEAGRPFCKCRLCGYAWMPRKSPDAVVECPRCKRRDWRSVKNFGQRRLVVTKREPYDPTNKRMAGAAVREALATGEITKKACETCGGKRAVAHHEDYSKPLEIRWLCASCHSRHHNGLPPEYRKNRAKPPNA